MTRKHPESIRKAEIAQYRTISVSNLRKHAATPLSPPVYHTFRVLSKNAAFLTHTIRVLSCGEASMRRHADAHAANSIRNSRSLQAYAEDAHALSTDIRALRHRTSCTH